MKLYLYLSTLYFVKNKIFIITIVIKKKIIIVIVSNIPPLRKVWLNGFYIF